MYDNFRFPPVLSKLLFSLPCQEMIQIILIMIMDKCIIVGTIILLIMNRTRPYLNRFVKQKQLQLTDIYHDLKMREIKPITTRLMEHSDAFTINNSKREMIREVRDIEIERENKLLLNKIERVMLTKGNYSVARTKSTHTKANKSLNEMVRRKQLESIQAENKRFLLRLQSKKATVDTMKLRKDWEDNKSVIKRMANCQFNLTHFISKDSRIRSFTSDRLFRHKIEDSKINRTKLIDGHKINIRIEFADGFLKIVGDCRDHRDLKVIEIPREEALVFLEKDCDGKMERLLDKLKYDQSTETLYLVSETIEETLNPERSPSQLASTLPLKATSTIDYTPKVNYHYHTITHRASEPPKHDTPEADFPRKSKKTEEMRDSLKKIQPETTAQHAEPKQQPISSDKHASATEELAHKANEEERKKQAAVAETQQNYNQVFEESKQQAAEPAASP